VFSICNMLSVLPGKSKCFVFQELSKCCLFLVKFGIGSVALKLSEVVEAHPLAVEFVEVGDGIVRVILSTDQNKKGLLCTVYVEHDIG
jgi:hypothetical protein